MNTVTPATFRPEFNSPKSLTAADSVDLTLDELSHLYFLSLVLLVDKVLAEICFSNAMEDYLRSSGLGLTVWARTEGRIAVIRQAVEMTRPMPKLCCSWSAAANPRPLVPPEHRAFAEITSLTDFERFVYVLYILEGYSDDECASLLECDPREVTAARDLANLLASASDYQADPQASSGCILGYASPLHERCGIC